MSKLQELEIDKLRKSPLKICFVLEKNHKKTSFHFLFIKEDIVQNVDLLQQCKHCI